MKQDLPVKTFSIKRILIPLAISFAVTFALIYFKGGEKGFMETFLEIKWTNHVLFFFGISVIVHALRDIAYIWRIRVLANKELSWKKCFEIVMLWETGSAVAPSSAGGTGIAMFILNREGINMGKSTAIILHTLLLDKLYYVVIVPILLLIAGTLHVFPSEMPLLNSLENYLIITFSLMILVTVLVYYGLFQNPALMKKWLVAIVFYFNFLKKFRKKIVKTGNDFILASKELKAQPFRYHAEAFAATALSWSSRFMVLNFILFALLPPFSHLLIYLRQVLAWLLMLLPTTPGASGVTEGTFSAILSDLGDVGVVTISIILWRFLTYYPYILIGIFIFPKWLKRTANKN